MALKHVEGKHEDGSDLFFWDDVLKDEGPESIFDFSLEEEEKEKPGRGWWGPPKGTHGKGEVPDLKDRAPKLTESMRANLEQQLAGVPSEHYRLVKEFTYETPPGYTIGPQSFIRDKDGFLAMGVAGIYGSGKVHLHYSTLSDPYYAQSIHEVGHFMSVFKLDMQNTGLMSVVPKLRRLSDGELGNHGLNKYSVSNGMELVADSYKVWLVGNPRQWAKLLGVWKEAGVDLEKEFGGPPPDRWDRG